MQRFKKICYILILTLLVYALVGCNTFRGMGEDIEASGQAIQEATK